jgi:DNA-binding transcriptional LysR family regulator
MQSVQAGGGKQSLRQAANEEASPVSLAGIIPAQWARHKTRHLLMKLRSIDLNLLVVLDALIAERSVQQAGKRLGLSQSATSHALDRLRKLLGDQLLVRTVSGMEPTPRALALVGPLREALHDIEIALTPESFDPAAAGGTFTFAVETYGTIVVLPKLLEIQKEAPGIEITVCSGGPDEIMAAIDRGDFDLAIGSFQHLPDRFMTCHLLTDSHVCLMRAKHPLAQVHLSLEKYLAARHLLLTMSGSLSDEVDRALASRDLARKVVMRVPHALAAVIALLQSDMLASVTRSAAQIFVETAPLFCTELPFPVAVAEFRLIWNRRLHHSPRHIWLRRKIVAFGTGA